jgi:hypothetical protein
MPSAHTLYTAPMLPGNDLGNATSETLLPDGRTGFLKLQLPSNNSLANKSFRVRLFGRVSTTANLNFQVRVYFGISGVIGSNTQIFDTNQININNAKSNWELWLDMTWDSDSKTITGRGAGQLANNILGPGTLLNIPIAADPNRDSNNFLQSGATYGFTVTGQFSGSSTGNHAFVDNFALEAV